MRLIQPNPLEHVTAIILAGGFGTRLQSVVSDRPKILAEVRGRPFVSWILDYIYSFGIRDTILCTGHMAEQVEASLGDGFRNMRLRYSAEQKPLGTAGAVIKALRLPTSEIVMVMNGDSLVQLNLVELWKAQARHFAPTIAVVEVSNTERFGRVETDGCNRIVSFVEKRESHGPGLINAGVYLIPTARFDGMPTDQVLSLERQIFPQWIDEGLYAYRTEGEFLDIGTPESFAGVNDECREWQLFNFNLGPQLKVLN